MIRYNNAAELAGLSARVAAFGGDGAALARNILVGKLAPSFRTILTNSEGPLMDLLGQSAREPERTAAVAAAADLDHRPIGPRAARPPVRPGGGHAMNPLTARPARTIIAALAAASLAYLVGYVGIWQWGICRIEVPPGSSLLLRYKGPWPFTWSVSQAPEGTLVRTAPSGRPLQVGVLAAMPGPGRHFYSPLEFETELVKDTIIPPGKIGVVVSKSGKPLPAGAYLVDDDGYRGILRRVLTPGRYRINPYGFDVTVVDVDACVEPRTRGRRKEGDPTLIPPGYVGVVTNKAEDPRTRQVRGIQPRVLQPGIYFLNPEEKRVDIISVGFAETTLLAEVAGGGGRRAGAVRPATSAATGSARRAAGGSRSTSRARGSSSPPTTAS